LEERFIHPLGCGENYLQRRMTGQLFCEPEIIEGFPARVLNYFVKKANFSPGIAKYMLFPEYA
jgi:hypothetical protein